jgi:TldD protein
MKSNPFETLYALDDMIYQRVLNAALERGGDYCDLYFQLSTSNTIALEDNEVNRAYRGADVGVGIRVVVGDTTGYAFCEVLDEKSMVEAAKLAAAIAQGGKNIDAQPIVVKSAADHYAIETQWSDVGALDKMPLLQQMNTRALAADPRITKVRLRFSDSESHVMVVDSLGGKTYDYQPMVTSYIYCVAEHQGRKEENYSTIGGRVDLSYFSEAKIHEAVDQAVARTLILFEADRPSGGEMPVVLGAGSSGILLHEAIGHGMEADFNRKGTSIYSDSIGQKIAPDFVSIVDDGTLSAARGSINVDDEGASSKRTVLVENGVLRSYMHDRISAKHYGVEPTGNGRRQSFRSMPLPRMRSTYMLNGPHKKDEIIASVKKGIYAETFTNGQVQIGAGDFTFYIKNGYLIEDGKLTQPIKDVNIIGNGPKVLKDVSMAADDMFIDEGGWTCGKDGQSVPVSIGMPTVKISSITVGGVKGPQGN